MKQILFTLALCCQLSILTAQTTTQPTDPNLSFEDHQKGSQFPKNWFQWGAGYSLSVDSTQANEGKRSMLIQSPADRKTDTFGCVATKIPAIYEGKEIELRGYLKLENVKNGSAGLLMRIDGVSGMLQFDNMEQKHIQGTSDWTQYSIKLPYSQSAKVINVGALLTGDGKMWVDNLELFVDGKPLREAAMKQPLAAELDKEFDQGSGIALNQLTAQQITDLAEIGRLWGFLKYYHPAIAAGKHNWDYELFRILPKIINTKSKEEKQQAIYTWTSKLGTFKANEVEKFEDGVDKMEPDFSWINEDNYSSKLLSRLDSVKKAERIDDHYYIGLTAHVGNPEFKNENPYATMKYPDAGYRLLSLFRYWNMIEYYFPYKYLIGQDWQKVLPEFVPKFINATNETEYKLAALALIARIHDTHANIYQDPTLEKFFGNQYAPVELTFVEDKPVVTNYFHQVLGEKSGLKIGDVIETINGKKIQQIIQEKMPLTPASNYPTQLRNIARDLLRTNDSLLTITYIRDNKPEQLKIKAYDKKTINIYANYNSRDTSFKMIRPDVSYLFPGKIKNSYLPSISPELLKSKGFVIDLRCYPSDFIVFSLANYLLPEPTGFAKFSVGSLARPGTFTLGSSVKNGSVNENYYKGKIVIIVNEQSQSQAEYTAMAFSTAPNVNVIGSTTAAADGNVSGIVLPGNVNTMISGIGVYYPDGRETQRIGIVPDIEVKPTIKGIREGRDELLEKALAIIDGK
ncbi:S41 family peptidase [Dyadobacter sp. CY312]|uniref:S41 family peptidase n=1 Tax=Dyadobacter sp. CY312 TaxID=2907303 RepID=UPI001F19617E|nr:S41 family peptidase [Dyadobacter sp. CY312]MCE7041451.1 S41 family peptidase [Dyadobacter sp. CY312]